MFFRIPYSSNPQCNSIILFSSSLIDNLLLFLSQHSKFSKEFSIIIYPIEKHLKLVLKTNKHFKSEAVKLFSNTYIKIFMIISSYFLPRFQYFNILCLGEICRQFFLLSFRFYIFFLLLFFRLLAFNAAKRPPN